MFRDAINVLHRYRDAILELTKGDSRIPKRSVIARRMLPSRVNRKSSRCKVRLSLIVGQRRETILEIEPSGAVVDGDDLNRADANLVGNPCDPRQGVRSAIRRQERCDVVVKNGRHGYSPSAGCFIDEPPAPQPACRSSPGTLPPHHSDPARSA